MEKEQPHIIKRKLQMMYTEELFKELIRTDTDEAYRNLVYETMLKRKSGPKLLKARGYMKEEL